VSSASWWQPRRRASSSARRSSELPSPLEIRHAHLEVDHVLGRHARHCRAADVLDPEGAWAEIVP
jgi:hypothetical protein